MFNINKQVLLAGAALAILGFAGAANAADLPTRKAPPPPMVPVAVPFSWTGFYVGATVGGDWGTGKTSIGNNASLSSAYVPYSIGSGPNGWQVGGEVGYNYQMGNIVVGVEDDLQWLSGSKSISYTGSTVPGLGGTLTTAGTYKLDWLGTTRARLGLATFDQDRLLLFVTGGLAYGGGNSSLSVTGPGGDSWYGSSSTTRFGWTLGAGAEYAITNNWSIKAEYLYYQLGSYTYSAAANTPAAATGLAFTGKAQPEGSIARVGVNYKF